MVLDHAVAADSILINGENEINENLILPQDLSQKNPRQS
jgi:hypothetical protein